MIALPTPRVPFGSVFTSPPPRLLILETAKAAARVGAGPSPAGQRAGIPAFGVWLAARHHVCSRRFGKRHWCSRCLRVVSEDKGALKRFAAEGCAKAASSDGCVVSSDPALHRSLVQFKMHFSNQSTFELGHIFRCWCIVSTLVSVLMKSEVSATRRGPASSDSILDIINTQEVERILAARRLNASQQERRFQSQNNLIEDGFTYDNPEAGNDFEKQTSKDSNNNRIDDDILLRQYNASAPLQPHELLKELASYNGQKLLKSSKNALFVTKKEYLKKDWCKTEPLVQRVREEGCLTRTIINRFCYGQCNSFYIPKNPRKRRMRQPMTTEDERDDMDQNGAAFKSCSFCKPKKFMWITVTLRCPSLNPPYKKKRIQRIRQCKCTSVDVN